MSSSMNRYITTRLQDPKYALHLAAWENNIVRLRELVVSNRDGLEHQQREFGTPLHLAIRGGQVDAVQILLDEGADPESLAPSIEGYPLDTSLTLAVRHGQHEVAKILWDRGVVRDFRTEGEKLTSLEIASCKGFDELVRDFLSWQDWDSKIVSSALSVAASRWNHDVLQVLLERGRFEQAALDKALWKAADTITMLPGERSRDIDANFLNQRNCIESLLDAGARVNSQQPITGCSALHIAMSLMAIEGLKILLERGADTNLRDQSGQTAFSSAARNASRRINPKNREEAIKLLLDHGALLSVTDNQGQTPIHLIAYYGKHALFLLCMEKYNNIFLRNMYGETLLHAAAAGNQLEIIQTLLASGIGIHETSLSGCTAIISAISTPYALQAINLLLDHGANATDTTKEGWTLLHHAARINENDEVIELVDRLITLGANTEARAQSKQGENIKGQTPLHWAAANGSIGVVKSLLRHNANPLAHDSTGALPALCAAYSQLPDAQYNVSKRQKVIKLLLIENDFYDEDVDGRSIYSWATNLGLPLNWAEW